jgi:Domain of unknown function (DUF5753)
LSFLLLTAGIVEVTALPPFPQVIPWALFVSGVVAGTFVIADFADAPSIVYLETALTGLVVERPEDVAAVTLSYETLRAEALSRSGSLDKLKEVRQIWT